jgi:hypothetical protein
MTFEIRLGLGYKHIYFLALIVLRKLSQTVGLENLLHKVGIFVGRLNELFHVLTLMIELVPHMQFFVRGVNVWLDKDSLLFKHNFIHDGSFGAAIQFSWSSPFPIC